ncbi:hypothetical protein SAMN04488078_101386 [Antarctobacter heliothermus]|uniref:Uncharacterized protein n=1 Tax=Antarctobacter heliothermus TaxID=74033 RepID=A0A239E6I9_9RHOB|nr:hypothetical protein SAMN04488078_101386 [Antarctobacter heliothermus]
MSGLAWVRYCFPRSIQPFDARGSADKTRHGSGIVLQVIMDCPRFGNRVRRVFGKLFHEFLHHSARSARLRADPAGDETAGVTRPGTPIGRAPIVVTSRLATNTCRAIFSFKLCLIALIDDAPPARHNNFAECVCLVLDAFRETRHLGVGAATSGVSGKVCGGICEIRSDNILRLRPVCQMGGHALRVPWRGYVRIS